MGIHDKQTLIDYLFDQHERLTKDLAKRDPDEEIFQEHLELIIVNELLYLLEEEKDILKTLVDAGVSYGDIADEYMLWHPDDEVDENLAFIVRDNFINKLNK